MKILCLGHLTYDTTLRMDSYPEENEKYRLDRKVECGGGPSANAGYLLGLWGEEVYVSGVLGNDYQGTRAKEEFEKIGVNTKYIETVEDMSTDSSYIIANLSNGSRTILTSAKDRLNHPQTLQIDEKFDVIELDGEEPHIAKEVLKNNPDAISVLDAGNLRNGTKELAGLVTYLVCSHDYAEDITEMKMNYDDINSIIKIYEKMQEMYNNNIIITLEAKGCFTKINDKYQIIPSINVEKPIDSTGAGDIFHGAFTYFITKKLPLEEVLLLSNITGALSVKGLGSRYSMPKLEEVLEERKKIDII